MLKKLAVLAGGITGFVILAVLALGPRCFSDLVTSQRLRIKEQTASLVDPAVEFSSAVQEAERVLPKRIADLKLAIAESEAELTTQVHSLCELREVLALIEKDLQILAPVVVHGATESCELHGQQYTREQGKELALRLIDKKRRYAELASAREDLIQRLRQQRAKMEEQLANAGTAVADFAENAKHVQAKIALVQASQKTEALQTSLGSDQLAAYSDPIKKLERRLDATWEEIGQREKLSEQLAGDSYVATVREQGMINDLKGYLAGGGNSEETQK